MTIFKKVLLVIVIILAVIVLVVAGYVAFLSYNYYRIEDNKVLEIDGGATESVETGKEYTAFTYNIGFGAYNREYSFFMDKGMMKDGTEVSGEYGKAVSEDAALENTDGVIKESEKLDADFNLFQEVDQKSTRSYFIDQEQNIKDAMSAGDAIDMTFASNFHSVYLAYPFNDPIGSIESGILTTSKYNIESAVRRSFPVTDSFINKFFDLDRCFVVNRIPVGDGNTEDDPHLVLINLHMSAYDKGGTIRKKQMKMLSEVLSKEMAKNNWVVVGGDLNHAIYGTEGSFDSDQEIPEWVQAFDDGSLPVGVTIVKADNIYDVATVRGSDMPYEEGVNFLAVIDGFIVSDNVTATAENIDGGFYYSDHNPVSLKFKLN